MYPLRQLFSLQGHATPCFVKKSVSMQLPQTHAHRIISARRLSLFQREDWAFLHMCAISQNTCISVGIFDTHGSHFEGTSGVILVSCDFEPWEIGVLSPESETPKAILPSSILCHAVFYYPGKLQGSPSPRCDFDFNAATLLQSVLWHYAIILQ